MNTITKNYSKVFRCGYCDLQYIFNGVEPVYYNSGVYGWNCDIYIDWRRDIAITTGYRNMRGLSIPHELIKKYSDIAKEIYNRSFSVPYDEIRDELEKNRENFLVELDELKEN